MNRLQATSRCECQAILTAMLDERRHVLHGAAKRHDDERTAPAHSMGADRENFDIGWLCPFCGRNTLRTFYAGALRTVSAEPVTMGETPKPPAQPVPAKQT